MVLSTSNHKLIHSCSTTTFLSPENYLLAIYGIIYSIPLHYFVANIIAQKVISQQPGLVFMLRVVSILLCGDVESNPGPTRYPCKLCSKPVGKTHRALCCDECDQWVHILCAGIPNTEYERLCADSSEDQWFCSICNGDSYHFECESFEHRQTRLLRNRSELLYN